VPKVQAALKAQGVSASQARPGQSFVLLLVWAEVSIPLSCLISVTSPSRLGEKSWYRRETK